MGRRRRKNNGDLIMPVALLGGFIVYFNPGLVDKALQFLLVLAVVCVCLFAVHNVYAKSGKNNRSLRLVSVADNVARKSVSPTLAHNSSENVNKWTIDLIKSLEWKRFEELCSSYFTEKGYKAEVTRQGADGGVDINLFKDSFSLSKPFGVVQCKAWNSYKVGVKPVRELFGVMAAEGAPLGVFITSGVYTNEARGFSANKRIKLMDGAELLKLIAELPEASQRSLLAKITNGDYITPSCPSCGVKMITRTTRKGSNAGNKFWGCRNFPKCKNTLKMKK